MIVSLLVMLAIGVLFTWWWNDTKEPTCKKNGHDWYYNFPSTPNKRICSRCKLRQGRDLHNLNLHDFDAEWTLTFEDSRTDDELIKKWIA